MKRWKELNFFLIIIQQQQEKKIFSRSWLRGFQPHKGSVKTNQISVPFHLTRLIIPLTFLLEGLFGPRNPEPGAGMGKLQGIRYVEIVTEKQGLAFWREAWDRVEKIILGSRSKASIAHPASLRAHFVPFPLETLAFRHSRAKDRLCADKQ